MTLRASILLFIATSTAAAQSPSIATGFREHVLGDSNGIRVVAWVRPEASFGDNDWLQIEIINRGAAGTIRDASFDAPGVSTGTWNSSNTLGSLDIGVGTVDTACRYRSVCHALPAGRYITREPGMYVGAQLGMRYSNLDVTIHLNLKLALFDGRSLAMTDSVPIRFRWLPPTAERIDTLRKLAVTFVEKAIAGAPRLSNAEVHMARELLSDQRTAEDIPLELALSAVRARQVSDSFQLDEVRGLVFGRWATDPRVIAFYRDALEARGPAALGDFANVGPWDESFIEPVVTITTSGPFDLLYHGLRVMDWRYASWSKDSTVAPRLSRAVLRIPPDSVVNGFYVWAELISLTHDLGAITALLPYLADTTINQFTSRSSNMPSGVTPMRNSEVAANAILRLLGEPKMVEEWQRARAPRGGPYPEWAEWDRRLVELRARLARLGYR